ncbi:MAG: hypothetical protein COA78_10115 [Blastopirellula sp.]|nr:MAG: hypothetical protein COA78_10115 [Blastopirellula sp.]
MVLSAFCIALQDWVAAMTIPELVVLQDQPYSERRRCGRRPSEVTGIQGIQLEFQTNFSLDLLGEMGTCLTSNRLASTPTSF